MKCITIITDAQFAIGSQSDINPASPELINASFRRLLQWLNQLVAGGVDLGIPEGTLPPTEPADELGNDPAFDLALSAWLAPWLAPIFQVPVSRETTNSASAAMQTLYSGSMLPNAPEWPETLPIGAGNTRGPKGRVYFPVPDYSPYNDTEDDIVTT